MPVPHRLTAVLLGGSLTSALLLAAPSPAHAVGVPNPGDVGVGASTTAFIQSFYTDPDTAGSVSPIRLNWDDSKIRADGRVQSEYNHPDLPPSPPPGHTCVLSLPCSDWRASAHASVDEARGTVRAYAAAYATLTPASQPASSAAMTNMVWANAVLHDTITLSAPATVTITGRLDGRLTASNNGHDQLPHGSISVSVYFGRGGERDPRSGASARVEPDDGSTDIDRPITLTAALPAGTTPVRITMRAFADAGGSVIASDTLNNAAMVDFDNTFNFDVAVSDGVTATSGSGLLPGTSGKTPAEDGTAPVISPSVDGPLGDNGWYVGDTSVDWSVDDPESTVTATDGCDRTMVSDDTAESTYSCTATSAGGTDSAAVTIHRDATPPTVAVTGITGGASYPLGAVPAAGCTTSDDTSGVAVPAALSVSGGPAGPVGPFAAVCDGARDRAGNTGRSEARYAVTYPFSGFGAPVANAPVINAAKAGRTIPIKFSLGGDRGTAILTPGSPASQTVACDDQATTVDLGEPVAAGTTGLSYDASSGQYNYLWKTDSAWRGCRRFTLRLVDGTTHEAFFRFR